MNAIDRFKEYFGMAPVAAYEDEYLDDYDRPDERTDRRGDYGYAADYDDFDRGPRHRDDRPDFGDDRRQPSYLREEEPRFAPEPPAPAYGSTRGAVALAPEHDLVDDGLVTYTETVVERPRGFADGKSIGENFRAGIAVVLDLSSLPKDDARRMVDFAAGLVFALDGRMEKVSDRERTFLLQPAGMDLTEAEIREAVNTAFRR